MSDIVEPTIDWLATVQMQSETLKKQAAEITRLRAALRDIEENSFSIYARDIARAALAAPSGEPEHE